MKTEIFALFILLLSISGEAAVCDELRPNFLWQWENCYETDGSSSDRITGDPNIANNSNFACLEVLLWGANGKNWALNALCQNQRHNPHVQEIYRACFQKLGATEFWTRLATVSTAETIDIKELQRNLEWQFKNNPDSIRSAQKLWKRFKKTNTPLHGVQAFGSLLTGQQHNRNAMDQYRTAFRVYRENLFARVMTF